MDWPFIIIPILFRFGGTHVESAGLNQAPAINAGANGLGYTSANAVAGGTGVASATRLSAIWIWTTDAIGAVFSATLAFLANLFRTTRATVLRSTNRVFAALMFPAIWYAFTLAFAIAVFMGLTRATVLRSTNRVFAALMFSAVWYAFTLAFVIAGFMGLTRATVLRSTNRVFTALMFPAVWYAFTLAFVIAGFMGFTGATRLVTNRIWSADPVTTCFFTAILLAPSICITAVTGFTGATRLLTHRVETADSITTLFFARRLGVSAWVGGWRIIR